MDIVRKICRQLIVLMSDKALCSANHIIDSPYFGLQEVDSPVLFGNRDFPIPLININGMGGIHWIIGSDGIHIGVEALTGFETEVGQGHAFPLGQGLHNLHFLIVHMAYLEGNRPFNSIQIVIDPGTGSHKKRRGDSGQIELKSQIGLECIFEFEYGSLGVFGIEKRFVIRGEYEVFHGWVLYRGPTGCANG